MSGQALCPTWYAMRPRNNGAREAHLFFPTVLHCSPYCLISTNSKRSFPQKAVALLLLPKFLWTERLDAWKVIQEVRTLQRGMGEGAGLVVRRSLIHRTSFHGFSIVQEMPHIWSHALGVFFLIFHSYITLWNYFLRILKRNYVVVETNRLWWHIRTTSQLKGIRVRGMYILSIQDCTCVPGT